MKKLPWSAESILRDRVRRNLNNAFPFSQYSIRLMLDESGNKIKRLQHYPCIGVESDLTMSSIVKRGGPKRDAKGSRPKWSQVEVGTPAGGGYATVCASLSGTMLCLDLGLLSAVIAREYAMQ
jgi:hypothetical protein